MIQEIRSLLLTQLRFQPLLRPLIPHRPHPEQDRPPAAPSVLKDVRMAGPLDLLVRAVVPQRPVLAFPRAEHTLPAAKDPLLVAGLGAALGGEEVVEPIVLDDMRAFRDPVQGLADHGRRRQGPSRREINLAYVDGEVFLFGVRCAIRESCGC